MSAISLFVPLVLRGARGASFIAAMMTTLSEDATVEYILADIPFFAVGILGFGVFTFLLFMRHISRVIVSLHVSIFLCFSAAVLDLLQLLFRGRDLSKDVSNTNPVLGLIISREILYAVASGVRFLSIWFLVACPPYGEPSSSKNGAHSGSWRRWGVFGIALQWIILGVIFAIMTLQILFRVFPPLEHFGPVYVTEVTMEIAVSSIFILKLFMNSFLVGIGSSSVRSAFVAVLYYTPLIFALAVQIGVDIGNYFEFLLSETILGRFLQAVELYILVLYILTTSFVHLRSIPIVSPIRNRSSSFQALPPILSRDSSFRITPPRVSTPDLETAMLQSRGVSLDPVPDPVLSPDPGRSVRASLARLSTWFGSRRVSKRLGLGNSVSSAASVVLDRLWDQDEAEKGFSPSNAEGFDTEGNIPPTLFEQSPTGTGFAQSAKYPDPLYTSVIPDDSTSSTISRAAVIYASTQSVSSRPDISLAIPPALPTAVSGNGDSDGSSPIYGLNGIVRSREARAPIDDNPAYADEDPDPRAYFDRTPRSSGRS
ncbi:hypothetical protein NM688_g8506 [Phlebia brevispora]|uniref:Uncharacterized protein n=1 Tax=Phlebia brevispora TaxID=194682 RepID=A0ACC1RR11_9APHY|nr:hypothetical protein NM688_g8506 [Phlebia brevispora]